MKRVLFLLAAALFTLSISAQVKVYTPSLKSPANNDTAQMPNVTLSWHAIAGSTGLMYEVQMDTAVTFDSPILKDTVLVLLTGYTNHELMFNQKYFWRVRAIDLGETSYWSEVWNFRTFNWVELDKPNANATKINPNELLKWKSTIKTVAITGISHFDYQADTSASFNSPLLIEGSTAYNVYQGTTANMRFGEKYYWRVRARHNLDVSDYCAPRSFTVIDDFTLASPGNNSTDQVLDVELKWNTVTGLLAYDYQIAYDQGFSNLVTEGEVITVTVNASFLMFGEPYYWRIRGRHSTDTSVWSTPYKFTTINTVLLVSPADTAKNVALTPLMSWTKQTGITGYELLLDTAVDFPDPVVMAKPDYKVTSYQVIKKLKPSSVYYWKMRAFSDGTLFADTTEWSTPFSFTTTAAVGIEEPEALSLSIYPNPARDILYFRVSGSNTGQVQLFLIDLLGRKVVESAMDIVPGQNTEAISLENIREGIYFARLQMGNKVINHKIIVEK
jgi:hypothetical protein